MNGQMPAVNMSKLQGTAAYGWAEAITKEEGAIRASKPKGDGKVAYVWRMVVFQVSPNPKHQCMPIMAECDVPSEADQYTLSELWALPQEERNRIRQDKRALIAYLDQIANQIVDAIPPSQWHGVRRWGQAFGMVGTPQYNAEGAVIYR